MDGQASPMAQRVSFGLAPGCELQADQVMRVKSQSQEVKCSVIWRKILEKKNSELKQEYGLALLGLSIVGFIPNSKANWILTSPILLTL